MFAVFGEFDSVFNLSNESFKRGGRIPGVVEFAVDLLQIMGGDDTILGDQELEHVTSFDV